MYSHSPDKNECEEEGEEEGEGEGGVDKPLCKEGTYCHNTPGSYRCNGEGMQRATSSCPQTSVCVEGAVTL